MTGVRRQPKVVNSSIVSK
ncbi:hypothetical protein A2U01_0064914, partial [Trifolium medium]|nr:hypothetical protein [Trifolium medium]